MAKINRFILFAIFATLTLASCTDGQTITPPNIMHSMPESSGYITLWNKYDLVVADNLTYPMLNSASTIFLIEARKIDEQGKFQLFAYSVDTGEQLWNLVMPKYPSSVFLYGNTYYRGAGGNGQVQALDVNTGNMLWETNLPLARSIVDLSVHEDRIFAYTINSLRYVLDKGGSVQIKSVYKDRILYETNGFSIFSHSGLIQAIDDVTEKEIWSVDIGADVGFIPLIENQIMFVRTKGNPNSIFAININTGDIVWRTETKAISNLCINNSRLFFLREDSNLVALDKEDGNTLRISEISPPIEFYTYPSKYYLACTPESDIVIITFGDNNQVVGMKTTDE